MLFGRRILFDLFIIGFYLTGNNQNTRLIRFTSACLFLSFIIFSVCLVSYTFVPYFFKPSEVECYNPHILNPEKSFTFSCCSYLFMSFQIGIVPTNTKGKRWLLGWFLPHQEFAKWTSKDVFFFLPYILGIAGWLCIKKDKI